MQHDVHWLATRTNPDSRRQMMSGFNRRDLFVVPSVFAPG